MHKVIASYLETFSVHHGIESLVESERFERFVNFAVVSSFFPDQFDIDDITTGTGDDSIDGVAVIIGDELVVSADDASSVFARLRPRQQVPARYIFVQAKRSESFDAGEMLKLGSGVQRILTDADGGPSDDVLKDFLKIHEVVVANLAKVENGRSDALLFYVTTGTWHEDNGLRPQLRYVETQLKSTGLLHSITYEPVDREKLIRFWLMSQAPVEATFPAKNYIAFPAIEGVTEAYLAIVPALEFVNRVLADDEGRIRASVFDQNVRAYLGDDNRVNVKIRASLQDKSAHDRFAVLNNGVTVVSPDVRVQSDRISVKDYQIVNGCQTSHVLFRNREALTDKVFVPVRVVEAADPGLIARMVEATNSQSNVEESQFLSTRPFVRQVEAYFDAFDNEEDRDRRLYFERRTRQFSGHNIARARLFDIQRLARCFASMFLEVPHLAARYPTQTFQERADQLFQSDHREVSYYAAALALYRLELSLGNQYVPRKYQIFKWHLLLIVRYQLAGRELPGLNSGRLEKYCARIIDAFSPGGKTSATPFLEATKVIDALGNANRDRLRQQKYTEEVKKALA
ncbi:MAG: hypothetical protein CVU57_16145 [Deltaproteobacteria bacterium HGW-Deltaproteobacteria-15]|jgi:hypothetical protein|nr:MAG: hypothetical protein CVU57_16145 [Deltaproteobacteria bacterium HGW-Deltaproteobacteria-15]